MPVDKGLQLKLDASRPEPLVRQLQEQLCTSIRTRQLRPGTKLPSMRRLVSQYGLSLGTVKQAINTLTAQGYLRAERGGGVFVAERELEQQGIALVLPALGLASIGQIIAGVKAGLRAGSRRVIVQAASFDFKEEAECIEQLESAQVAGAIIYPSPMLDFVDVLRKLASRGVPHVLVDTAFDSLVVDSVTTDCRAMGLHAMQYLLDRGHRKIGVIELSANSSSFDELRAGMDEALAGYGLSYESLPRIVTDATDLNPSLPWANGERAGLRLLAENPDVTALIGVNEHLSLGALRAVRASGRRVPQDVSVLSISDLPAFIATDPAVTAIAQPHEEMGRVAADRLLQILRGEGPAEPQRVKLKPTLCERDSVIPCPRDAGESPAHSRRSPGLARQSSHFD